MNNWNNEKANPVEDIKAMVKLVKSKIGYQRCPACNNIFDDVKPDGIITKCPVCNLYETKNET